MTAIPGICTAYSDVTLRQFEEEILPKNRPAVLKGLVMDWPSVRAGLHSRGTLATYLKQMDAGVQSKVSQRPLITRDGSSTATICAASTFRKRKAR
jgi:hypothetical protein